MNLKVLGCSGSALPGHELTSFLIDNSILLDAGSVTSNLALEEQAQISDIFVTHSHLDHIKDILFLADNLIEFFDGNTRPPVNIRGMQCVLDNIAKHLLNDTIWPDFTVIPQSSPILTYSPLEPGQPVKVNGFEVRTFPVNHASCASGYVVAGPGEDETLVYTGDTGPNDKWWDFLNSLDFKVKNFITEASFPNSLAELAHISKHLTPLLLREELAKLSYKPKIFIYHMKSPFSSQIQEELQTALAGYSYHLLREGESFDF